MSKKIKITSVILILCTIGILTYLNNNKMRQDNENNQETTEQRDIFQIRKFAENPEAKVEFVNKGIASNVEGVPVSVYYSGADQYEIDASGKILEFRSRDLPIGSENEKVVDYSLHYNQQELENIARLLIAKNINTDLANLTLSQGNKGANYFFRWEDKNKRTTNGYPFIQVSFSQGGTLIGYINAL